MTSPIETFKALVEDRIQSNGYAKNNGQGLEFQYGNARVAVNLYSPDKFQTTFMYDLRGRKEGGAGDPRNASSLPLTLDTYDEQAALDWTLEVLSTGRTCEVGKGIGLRKLNTWPPFSPVHYGFRYLQEEVLGLDSDHRPAWNLNPDYQRGAVWTQTQQSRFVGHLLEGGQSPVLFVQRYDSPQNAPAGHKKDYYDLPIEVIDGQQRIRAILAWMADEIPAEVADGRLFWHKDTNEIDRRCLPSVQVAILDIPRVERLEFYLKLNAGGTAHSDTEIESARKLLAAEKAKKV